ncbi:MAG: protein phosphatase [Candidatus Contendobacter odensis]|uniref:Protein phosphatase n=1 Tax=Candidatus Contendibacter odensensis TaxID=1400860 RepID=A0A2G6PFM8_9GAMM|nr:MAG: protein phosphatase [Candidatus Contendobacter odensis]
MQNNHNAHPHIIGSTCLDSAAEQGSHRVQYDIAVRSLCSPTGQGRRENQDNYLIIDGQGCARFLSSELEHCIQASNWPANHQRVAVLDGMGGHTHGREAAEQLVEGVLNIPATCDLNTLNEALSALHQKLHEQFHSMGLDSGCTMVLLEIPPADSPALLFHVGDSRLYAIDKQKVRYLTIDHVPATHMAILGLIDKSKWTRQVHERPGSQLSQAFILGTTMNTSHPFKGVITPELFELKGDNIPPFLQGLDDRRLITLDADTLYLLASDGLWNLRYPQRFISRWSELLLQPQRSLEELLDTLLAELAKTIQQQRSQPDDNCTAVLIRKSVSTTQPAAPNKNPD